MMMRPSGPATFSNFDFLPETLATPAGFPEHAVIRSDVAKPDISAEVFRPHLGLFFERWGKEFLLNAKGLRIVIQAAEAERSRYVVMRDAQFGDIRIDADLARRCLDELIDLNEELKKSGP